MKRMLAILGSLGLTATTGLSVVACSKSSDEFNTFMNYINETKGSYDENGLPETKSSASVIYIGAKDNGSSQSFQSALENAFGDLDSAKIALSKETNVTKTNPIVFSNISIVNKSFTLTATQANRLRYSAVLKAEMNLGVFDASINSNGNGTFSVSLITDETFPPSITTKITLTGYRHAKISFQPPTVAGWNTAYLNWLTQINADRSIRDIDLNLDPNSKEFGKVSAIDKPDPVYGIKGDQQTGLRSTAYDYAKIKFSLKTIIVDKVANYWNTDLFKKLANDYLKKDLMYQLTANSNPQVGKDDTTYKNRQTMINDYLTEIKSAKGPLFLIVKNGHVIKIMKGWTRYKKFGNNKIEVENPDKDLNSWTYEISQILSNSFLENNSGLFGIGAKATVNTWAFATGDSKDDSGASNWDSEKNIPTGE